MIGVVGWDGTSVVLSDVGDTTVHDCTLVDQNTLHCLVWEAGAHALVGRITLAWEQAKGAGSERAATANPRPNHPPRQAA